MGELKPCPFCGHEAEIEVYGNHREGTYYKCTNCSCALETSETFNHGYQWNTRADGWVSVDDGLPLEVNESVIHESITVIATDGEHVINCEFNRGNGGGEPWAEWSAYNELASYDITHWMPLPEPPKA